MIWGERRYIVQPLRLPTNRISLLIRLNLTLLWRLVKIVTVHLFDCLQTQSQRGEHNIDDELVFSNNDGYVFHDSRGIESGSTEELGILQEFIQRKCGERRLGERLHAIWFGCSIVHD